MLKLAKILDFMKFAWRHLWRSPRVNKNWPTLEEVFYLILGKILTLRLS